MIGRLALAVVVVATVAASPPADAAPSRGRLVLTGVGLAPPTYLAGVALHEGSHALAAVLVGGDVVSVDIFPGRDPQTGAFHFGLTRVRGLPGRGAKLFFYAAPKLADLALLGGFTAWVLSDAWPRNHYAQLALTVGATGLWVDFSKDVLAFSRHNDVVKAMNLYCLDDEWRRLPVRLLYAGASVGFGLAVARGYRRTFEREATASPALVIPLLRAAF